MKLLIALLLTLCPVALRAELSESDALAFLRKHAPEILHKVAPLKTNAPEDYLSALDDAKKAAADYTKIETAGDAAAAAAYLKMYALDYAAIEVADEIVAAAGTADTERLTKKLRTLIDASFEQWAIVEQARIQRMETELTKLKADLGQAISGRGKVVESDTAKLIEECRTFQQSKAKPKSK